MSKSSTMAPTNRVVSLNGLSRDRSPGQRILAECRDQLVTSLSAWLRDVAAPVSEELFVLADSTRERLQQTRYLDLRVDIEKDWGPLVETFRRDLSAEAERCQNQEIQKESSRDTALEIPDFEGLQLLGDDDLSEHIVIREFSAQLCESCDEELYTLNRRVAALMGLDELSDSANPLAPPVVCRALSDACATIGSDAPARLILLRRLERHLHLALPGIYRQINDYLIERGILPDLKRSYRRASRPGEVGSAGGVFPAGAAGNLTGGPTGGAGMAGSPTIGGSVAVLGNEGILDALQRLAQARMARAVSSGSLMAGGAGVALGGTSGIPGATTDAASGVMIDSATVNQLLLASLNELQHAPVGVIGGEIVNQVRLVRDSEGAKQVGGLESVTIDIVAMLFDFIFDDAHIPVAIKALISRLQIPVLKVVMLNPSFFADRQHPTRRFLGSISSIAIRWGVSVDESDPFYAKLAELVDRIQAEFENDIEVFGTALAELEAFVDERDDEEEGTALKAANIVMMREREAEAWERAQQAFKAFSARAALPASIETFLREHWVGVLQSIAFKEGDNEAEWDAAIQTLDDLVWSIVPKKSPDDRLRLVGLLPKLLAQLNKGLDSVAANAEQRRTFFDGLVQCHSGALKGEIREEEVTVEAEVVEPVIKPSDEGDLLVTRSVDDGVEVEEVTLVGAAPIWRADDRDIFRQVSELKRGDWVGFRDADGNVNNERVNWISPQRGILLFSNHRSAKAISIAPEALVRQIRDGNAVILHEEPIFERALSGALESINIA